MPERDAEAQVTTFVEAFGLAVRQCRKELAISQEELGFRADFDRTYISGIERGVRDPTLRALARLARALSARPSELLRRTERLLKAGPR